MKLSLVFASSLALFAAACGTTAEEPAPPAPQAPVEAPAETPPPAPRRQLVDGTSQPTSPVNLLVDPGFGLVGAASYSGFIAFGERSASPFELATTLDSRSPAGLGGAVARVKPEGATDTSSEAVMILASVLGGGGPYRAQVWFSKSDVKGKPVDLPTDGSAVTATLTQDDPDGVAFDLTPVDGATRTTGARTWVLYRAEVTKPLTYGGFFLIRTGTKGGEILIAAPEVTTAEIVAGAPVRSRATPVATGRPLTGSERAAIRKVRAIPPRLLPAAPKSRPGL